MERKGEIIIYQTEDGKNQLDVTLQEESLWLNLNQMTQLFGRDKSVISRHIKNIFKEGELSENSVVAKNATTASDGKTYQVENFNLDLILSVGYRVNSKRGTQFRIWATQTLKDHLVKGFTINEKRLKEQQEKFKELNQTVDFLKTTIGNKKLSSTETQGLLEIISTYTRSFILLNQYDSNALQAEISGKPLTYEINYDEAISAIEQLKKQLLKKGEASQLFGRQRNESFSGILNVILQTFSGKYLYPSVEEQAAHLLYFIIKNHSFADGNKRIGAFLFVWFLHRNKHLLKKEGEVKINDNALVALALLVAQSDPANKDLMIALIVNLINE